MKLEARGVGKYYLGKRAGIGCFYAVRGADLCILPGRVTALMGRSGSGKTTLMQMMAGLLKPDAGTVLLDERNLSSCSDEELCALRRHHFGVVPQGADLLPQLTVMENLLLPLAMEGRGEEEIFFQRARNLLDRLGIADLEHVFAKDLSGGERRRVCIIRSLLPSPD
ncbi:MAG: ATP-binding cassette domain-containing protein, partial [Blautia sp.]|nr:ATP-binding cassette domain-containing protein [Blautia sp.]